MLAGLTVSLTLIPQSIAYAEIAGLQPQVYILLLWNFRIEFQKYIHLDQVKSSLGLFLFALSINRIHL
jgi:MFS superfamily sulfate permease-like transporter